MKRKLLILCTTLALALFGLAACSSGSGAPSSANDASSAPEAEAQTGSIVINDQRGVDVELEKPATRVATAVIPAPAIIAAVDGTYEHIVGVNETTLYMNQKGMASVFWPESTETTAICDSSFVPNMETLLGTQPDVVVQWADSGDDLIAPIEEAGLPMIGLLYGTQEDLETWISMFGQMLGKDDRATEINNKMHEAQQDIEQSIASLGLEDVKAVTFARAAGDNFATFNGSSYDGFIYSIIAGDQVSKDVSGSNSEISAEQLIDWNPEVIFLSGLDDATPADFYDNPQLQDINAVKNKRVYKTPMGVFSWQIPCAESYMAWYWMATLLHPEEFSVDMRSMMKEEMAFLYNHDCTDEEIDRILNMEMNQDSQYYTELFG